MHQLIPLESIFVPEPKKDVVYSTEIFEKSFSFTGLKSLLGAADVSKAGDRMAGLAADSPLCREAARKILSALTIEHIYDHPITDRAGDIDEVMRVGYQIDPLVFDEIKHLTIGAVRDRLLAEDGEAIKRIGSGLTPIMVAAITKLLDVHELVYLGKQIVHSTKARTRIGEKGVLSFRLQPNHPTDHLEAISLLIYNDLAMGMGDCLIGVNPAVDTVDNVKSLLVHMDKIRTSLEVPTQICVLAHIKTQLKALAQGAPVEILFQSLAGTSATLTEEFDVTIDLLDKAYHTMKEAGPLKDFAEQTLYFETGQGSEVTYDKHNDMDMTTCEALCYGVARRYDPFMVNNATGFIGPETHLEDFELIIANLQDLFMGKLMGLPMGISPSYTMHSNTHREGQQMATQLLTAAGANYFIDVYLGTDRMLAHFVNGSHDNQTLRDVHDRKPTPAFLEWSLRHGIFKQLQDGRVVRGPNWANPRTFCPSESEFQRLSQNLPLTYDFQSAGPRPTNAVSREICSNQAITRMAIGSDLNLDLISKLGIPFRKVKTKAHSRPSYLANPDLGTQLNEGCAEALATEGNNIQIIISDGLSAEAIHHNIPDLLPILHDGLTSREYTKGMDMVIPYGRVKVSEPVAEKVRADLTIVLIGERPGGGSMASKSMSAYLVYQLLDEGVQKRAAAFSGHPDIRFEYTLITNIYRDGLPATEAGSLITEKAFRILEHKAAGNRLESLL